MSEPARILVVDDDESIRKPLAAILEEEDTSLILPKTEKK